MRSLLLDTLVKLFTSSGKFVNISHLESGMCMPGFDTLMRFGNFATLCHTLKKQHNKNVCSSSNTKIHEKLEIKDSSSEENHPFFGCLFFG